MRDEDEDDEGESKKCVDVDFETSKLDKLTKNLI